MNMNRLANVSNPFQGKRKKVLCVCSAGLLRSPTAAWILSNEPFGFNTRAVGCSKEYALIPVDNALILWADEIICMEDWQKNLIEEFMYSEKKPIHILKVSDSYEFRQQELVDEMLPKLKEIFIENTIA